MLMFSNKPTKSKKTSLVYVKVYPLNQQNIRLALVGKKNVNRDKNSASYSQSTPQGEKESLHACPTAASISELGLQKKIN